MRKIDKKNTISFYIFGALVLLLVGVISVVVLNVYGKDSESYAVEVQARLCDEKGVLQDTAEGGEISRGWDGKYYYRTSGDSIELGEHALLLDGSNRLHIFGTGYEVTEKGQISALLGETVVDSLTDSRFFKLSDRLYLMTGHEITDQSNVFGAEGFVLIRAGINGAATLCNDSLNQNTVRPMVLKSGDLYFDIASELLYDGATITGTADIIGSSSQYLGSPLLYSMGIAENPDANAREEKIVIKGGTGGSGGEGGLGGEGGIGGSGGEGGLGGEGGIGGIGGNGGSGGEGGTAGNGGVGGTGGTGGGGGAGRNQYKNVTYECDASLGSVYADMTTVTVDYSINDPANQYAEVYLTLLEANSNHTTTSDQPLIINYLDRSSSSVTLSSDYYNDSSKTSTHKLKSGTKYTAQLFATVYNKNSEGRYVRETKMLGSADVTTKAAAVNLAFESIYRDGNTQDVTITYNVQSADVSLFQEMYITFSYSWSDASGTHTKSFDPVVLDARTEGAGLYQVSSGDGYTGTITLKNETGTGAEQAQEALVSGKLVLTMTVTDRASGPNFTQSIKTHL